VPWHYCYRRGSLLRADAGVDWTADWHPQRAVFTNTALRFSAVIGCCPSGIDSAICRTIGCRSARLRIPLKP
jgi:hypothetical protein